MRIKMLGEQIVQEAFALYAEWERHIPEWMQDIDIVDRIEWYYRHWLELQMAD